MVGEEETRGKLHGKAMLYTEITPGPGVAHETDDDPLPCPGSCKTKKNQQEKPKNTGAPSGAEVSTMAELANFRLALR